MFASPTQLPTVVREVCGLFADTGALFVKAPASPSSSQAELVLVLARKAQPSAVLRVARGWEGHKEQPRRSESNRR